MSIVLSHRTRAEEFVKEFRKRHPEYKTKLTNSLISSFFGNTSDVKISLGWFNSFWIVFCDGSYAETSTSRIDRVITKEQVKVAKKANTVLKGNLRIIQ